MDWNELLLPILLTILTAVLGWIGAFLKKKFDIDIEAKDREALHSALRTGVESALSKDKTIKTATVDTVQATKPIIIKEALEYAQKSVPDAIRRLDPTGGLLADIALSKLEQIVQGNVR